MSDHIAAYVDFWPNEPKTNEGRDALKKSMRDRFEAQLQDSVERTWELPPIVVRDGDYVRLLTEARSLFIAGYFYSCVAMCGIVGERLIKDVLRASVLIDKNGQAAHPSERAFDQFERVEADAILKFLSVEGLISDEARKAAEKVRDLRNAYSHARGKEPHTDALTAIKELHTLVEATVSLADATIPNGATVRITTTEK